jgi:Protein of unknown function (DUF2384)
MMTGPDQGDDAEVLDRPAVDPDAEAEAATVAKATIRAAEILDVGPVVLAKILGLSYAGAERLLNGRFDLAPVGGPFVRAVLLVRIFSALDTIMGGDEQAARSWLRARSNALGGIPLALMQTPRGLIPVCQHLEARLARV